MIVEKIRTELKHNPSVFFPYGAVGQKQLSKTLKIYDFRFPEELVELWYTFGGGDLFQEETFLYPLVTEKQEIQDIKRHNEFYLKKGFDNKWFIFETDSVNLAAFHKSTQEIAVFFYKDFSVRQKHPNIKHWFDDLWNENV